MLEVVIHRQGQVGQEIIEAVARAVGERFGAHVSEGKTLAIPPGAFNEDREQYAADELLDLTVIESGRDDKVHLSITDVDIYAAELNYVLGMASPIDRAAILSMARLDPRTTTEDVVEEKTVERRAVTEAVHELGHIFGLNHCNRRDCVMWFSNTVAETDRKGTMFCPYHERELQRSIAA